MSNYKWPREYEEDIRNVVDVREQRNLDVDHHIRIVSVLPSWILEVPMSNLRHKMYINNRGAKFCE